MRLGHPPGPFTDAILTIEPRLWGTIMRAAARHIWNVPRKFTSMILCHGPISRSIANLTSSTKPAAFTTTSSPPRALAASATIASASSSTDTSPMNVLKAPTISRAFTSPSALISASATLAPSSHNKPAVAAPMPLAPPVTRADRPKRDIDWLAMIYPPL